MKQYLYIGLGNPGKKFEQTRHNLGIRLLRAWVEHVRPAATHIVDWRDVPKLNAALAEVTLADTKITCLFPLTFMNNSGRAVRRFFPRGLSRLWQSKPRFDDTLIIHDALEVPLGQFRIKSEGSARGHRGVRSIHEALGTQTVPRLLLGIGPPPSASWRSGADGVSNYVLEKFTPDEEKKITSVMSEVLVKLDSPHNPTDEQNRGA